MGPDPNCLQGTPIKCLRLVTGALFVLAIMPELFKITLIGCMEGETGGIKDPSPGESL